MLIYRIRNKSTGQYLVNPNTGSPGGPDFNNSGCFWRTIDTIVKHLDELCRDYIWVDDDGNQRFPGHKTLYVIWHHKAKEVGYYPERLENYEVVIHDITVNGENVIQGIDLEKDIQKLKVILCV